MTSTERLEKVARKQEEWKNLPTSRKLELIDEILEGMRAIGLEGWMENSRGAAQLFKVEATSLPLLVVDINVDITTEEGIEKAKTEYAFSHEPFAPVLVLVVIDDTHDEAKPFLELATQFCNEFLFGSLACHMTVPPSMDRSTEIEGAIANLKYGTVAVNMFAISFSISSSLAWGAFPGDRLEDVESGMGKVQNRLFLPRVEKCVIRTPIIFPGHVVPKDNETHQNATAERLGICKFFLNLSGNS